MLDFLLNLKAKGHNLDEIVFSYDEYNDEMKYTTEVTLSSEPYLDNNKIFLC